MNLQSVKFLLLVTTTLISTTLFSQKDSLSFLALGDSYTIGTAEKYKFCWPIQLQEKLAKKNILMKEPKIIAGAGWTTQKLLKQIKIETPQQHYDLVSLLIGVNNQYRNQSIKDFEEDFSLLLDKSIAFAKNDKTKVFVLSIPDWSATPFAQSKDRKKISKEINDFNAIVKKETEKRDVLYIDITKLSREAFFDKLLIAADSLHPSRRMYKLWVKKINKSLEQNFKY